MYRKKRIAQFLLFAVFTPVLVLGVSVLVTVFLPTVPWWAVMPVALSLWGILLWWEITMQTDSGFVSKRELDLLASQEKFSTLYEHSPVPYVTINAAGEVLTANLAAVRLFQTSIDAIQGLRLFSLLQFTDTNAKSMITSKLAVQVPVKDVEAEVTGLSGECWVLLSIYSYAGGKEILVSLVDITQQKIVDTAKSEFVALATHQLRTPVAAMRWNAELLRKNMQDTLTDSANSYLTKIERNILRMVDLINDFLSVSKLETGTFATEFTAVSLAEQFDAVCDEFANSIAKKRIKLVREYVPADAVFSTDTRLFHIIVSNIMSNAVKYVADEATITIGYKYGAHTLTITITDTGIGIPEAELDTLFTKFFRASNAQAQQAEGTGLGLYIVKQSVEKLGGTIAIRSIEHDGTTLTIKLPTKPK